MRAVWLDLGAFADVERLARYGITRVYADARNPFPSLENKLSHGIYRCQSWDNFGPEQLASVLSSDVSFCASHGYKQLAVHANIELHDSAYIRDFLFAWRKLRPIRETGLVIEGLQAGWFTSVLIGLINADKNLTVLPEAYTGSMEPIDADDVRSNLVNYGIDRAKALVMYDGARLSPFWDGCAFTQQRLP